MAADADAEAGTDLFSSYETEFKLVRADLTQKLDQVPELSGEQRKAALASAQTSLDEATELLEQIQLEKYNVPSASRAAINRRLRDYASDLDAAKRKARSLSQGRAALFGDRFTDDPEGLEGAAVGGGGSGGDIHLEQRERLLHGTERLDRSTQRLKASQALANETEAIGASTLADLHSQRETIGHTTRVLYESEGYVDKSIKTLRGMARRMATNRIITITIITVLILLIFAVIYSKFR